MTWMTRSRSGKTPMALAIRFRLFVASWFAALAISPLHGDTVWFNDNSEPRHGRIIQITTDAIVFESVENSGTAETILRTAIRTWHRSIDPVRLESLRPDSPSGYLEYAEVLAGIRFDPASMNLSRRLAIIALHIELAKHDTEEAHSDVAIRSLALILAIAQDDTEKQKLVRLGIANGLMNAPNDASSNIGDSDQAQFAPDQEEARFLLEQLRSIRRGEFRSASDEPAMDRMTNAIKDWQLLMTDRELKGCVSASSLSSAQLLRLVRLENSIAEYLESGRQIEMDLGWATTSRLPAISVPKAITTRKVTEFDPDQCLWRDGKWVKRDK